MLESTTPIHSISKTPSCEGNHRNIRRASAPAPAEAARVASIVDAEHALDKRTGAIDIGGEPVSD